MITLHERFDGFVAKVFPQYAFVQIIPSPSSPPPEEHEQEVVLESTSPSVQIPAPSVSAVAAPPPVPTGYRHHLGGGGGGGGGVDPEELHEGRQFFCSLTPSTSFNPHHHSSSHQQQRRLELIAGQIIQFSLEPNERGPRAVRVTGPMGVDLLSAPPIVRKELLPPPPPPKKKKSKTKEEEGHQTHASEMAEKTKAAEEKKKRSRDANTAADGEERSDDDNDDDGEGEEEAKTPEEAEALARQRRERREKSKEARRVAREKKVPTIEQLARAAVCEALVSDAETRLPPYQPLPMQRIMLPSNPRSFAEAKVFLLSQRVLGFDTETRPVFVAQPKPNPPPPSSSSSPLSSSSAPQPLLPPPPRPKAPDLVQFATLDTAVLIQMRHGPMAADLVAAVMRAAHITKVGFGLQNDRKAIAAAYGNIINANAATAVNSHHANHHPHRQHHSNASSNGGEAALLELLQTTLVDVDAMVGAHQLIGIRKAVPAVLNEYFHKSKKTTMTNWALAYLTPQQIQYAASDAHGALRVYLRLVGEGAGAGSGGISSGNAPLHHRGGWKAEVFDLMVKEEMARIKLKKEREAEAAAAAAEASAAVSPAAAVVAAVEAR